MILNGEYVEKLTDEELCMLEQLTYLSGELCATLPYIIKDVLGSQSRKIYLTIHTEKFT